MIIYQLDCSISHLVSSIQVGMENYKPIFESTELFLLEEKVKEKLTKYKEAALLLRQTLTHYITEKETNE